MTDQAELTARSIIRSRRTLPEAPHTETKTACEGGCGVIGIIGSATLPGGLIIRSCGQMRNRGNGKGGGVAAVGLFEPGLKPMYALHIAYLDENSLNEVEERYVQPVFDVAHSEWQPNISDHRDAGLSICPPRVRRYFVRPKKDLAAAFAKEHAITSEEAAEDELVFQNSFRLNYEYYAKSPSPRAFVLSHGRDLMILKAVGYAEEVARYYQLEETKAHVWIGHQRYPTRGRVWHPGGAHPFAGLHEALVHNGDFANYYAVSEYLSQRGLVPLFVTDTEVSALLFDLYSRVFSYPLEFIIEALAPTPEGDFERLSKRRQRLYRAIQSAHLHGSPDGPWFFIIARGEPRTRAPQLLGITDVSMLRPQVFAYQRSSAGSFGAIASEKQAIDAFFEDVAASYPGVSPVADSYWNARGGSAADGGAFAFTLCNTDNGPQVCIQDKFGNDLTLAKGNGPTQDRRLSAPPICLLSTTPARLKQMLPDSKEQSAAAHPAPARGQTPPRSERSSEREEKLTWGELSERPTLQLLAADLRTVFQENRIDDLRRVIMRSTAEAGISGTLQVLTYLRDRRWNTRAGRRAEVLSVLDGEINALLDSVPGLADPKDEQLLRLTSADPWIRQAIWPEGRSCVVIDARGFPPEGSEAACRLLVSCYQAGWRHIVVYRCQGDRFLGCGLGPQSAGLRIDVYGSSGDYLGSGVDGAHLYVHGNAQDQLGQILKSGRLVVFGDVGQTFLYGAKGGEAFVLGNAAGRPLINAVGKIRAVINGTCLDYCAESFMAGRDTGDGFVIINGISFDNRGLVLGLEHKYPGNNLFSLASGGSCYLNDPYHTVKPSQLNGGEFVRLRQHDWNIIVGYLRTNEELFGISIRRDLLLVDGVLLWPKEVFRKVVASRVTTRLGWSSLPD